MPRSRSRNVVSVRSAKSARGMFSTGTKAALGAGEVCGGGVTPSAVTPGEVSPRPPTVPGEVAKPHLGQEMGQGQCRDSGVQVTGLVAHHHVDLLVLLDVILQRWEASVTAARRPHPQKHPNCSLVLIKCPWSHSSQLSPIESTLWTSSWHPWAWLGSSSGTKASGVWGTCVKGGGSGFQENSTSATNPRGDRDHPSPAALGPFTALTHLF